MYASIIATFLVASATALPNYGSVTEPSTNVTYGTPAAPASDNANNHYGTNDQTLVPPSSHDQTQQNHNETTSYGQVPPPPPKTSCDDQNSQSQNSTFAAVLFDGAQMTSIKHWVDGNVDECRGLSGVSVNSTVPVAYPGADPSNSGSARSDFELVFFSNFSCSGDMLGAVPASTADVFSTLGRAVFPLSVQFRQIDVTYTEEQQQQNQIADVAPSDSVDTEVAESETSNDANAGDIDPINSLSDESSASTISFSAALVVSAAALFI